MTLIDIRELERVIHRVTLTSVYSKTFMHPGSGKSSRKCCCYTDVDGDANLQYICLYELMNNKNR